MALTVEISGNTNIAAGAETTLTASVVGGTAATYAWTTTNGSFVGATTGASVVFRAGTDDATVSVSVTSLANPNADSGQASVNISVSTPVVPISISAFAHQRVTLGTEIALDINITGNPDFAYIEGLLEGFYTNWNSPILEVRGAASRLISNAPFTVKALRRAQAPVTRDGLFSVVPAAPVITAPGRQTFYRGIENEFIVRISNSPSRVHAVGPWVGMKSESHPDGIRVFGIVPEVLHAIPGADQTIRVTAASGLLMDEVEIDFDLTDIAIYTSSSDDIYQIQLNESDQSVSSILSFDTDFVANDYLASDADYVYSHYETGPSQRGNRLSKVSRSTTNGASVAATFIFFNNRRGYGLAIDGNDIYRAVRSNSIADQIQVFDKNQTPIRTQINPTRKFQFRPVGNRRKGIAIDGDEIVVLNGDRLQWYNKNLEGSGFKQHNREIMLGSSAYHDIEVLADTIYMTNPSAKTITSIDIETGNVIATYTLPISLPSMYGVTIAR